VEGLIAADRHDKPFHPLLPCRIHAEENKRRTLQRSDIAAAIAKTDMFDFLIDIVPREEYKISLPKEHKTQHSIVGHHDRRHSQEVFQPVPGPGSATGPKGSGVAGVGIGGVVDPGLALEQYYPYGVLGHGAFAMVSEKWIVMQLNGLCHRSHSPLSTFHDPGSRTAPDALYQPSTAAEI
jgi:hypothetical protein